MNKPSPLIALSWLRQQFRPAYLGVAALMLFCLIIGAAMPIYVAVMDGQASRLVAFPAALILTLLLLYDRKMTLLLVIVTRASGDFFLQFTRFSLGGFQLGVGGLINALVILIAILMLIEKPGQVPRKVYLMWSPFLFVAFVGVLLAPEPPDALRAWLGQLSNFAIFISAFHFIRSEEDFNRCVKITLLSGVFPCFFGFVDIALHHGTVGEDGEGFRVASTFGHPNEFAFYLTMMISLAFYTLKTLPKKNHFRNQVFLGGYTILMLGMLLLTKTRSAWFACALGFGLYALFFERRLLIYMFFMGVIALFIPGVGDRLADLQQGNEVSGYAKLNSFEWRLYLWRTGLDWMTPGHYLHGYGYNSFKIFSPIFFPLAGKINWNAHSVYVQLIFELGAIGVASYFWLYYKALDQLKRLFAIDRMASFWLIIMTCNYLISSVSDNMLDYLAVNWYLWFIVGVACAYVNSKIKPVVQRMPTFAPSDNSMHPIAPRNGTLRGLPASYKTYERE